MTSKWHSSGRCHRVLLSPYISRRFVGRLASLLRSLLVMAPHFVMNLGFINLTLPIHTSQYSGLWIQSGISLLSPHISQLHFYTAETIFFHHRYYPSIFPIQNGSLFHWISFQWRLYFILFLLNFFNMYLESVGTQFFHLSWLTIFFHHLFSFHSPLWLFIHYLSSPAYAI